MQHATYITSPPPHIFRYSDSKALCHVCHRRLAFRFNLRCSGV
jgi:hypothetical protein